MKTTLLPLPDDEYAVYCETCHWGKKYGAAKFRAYREARKHHDRYVDHRTHVQKIVSDFVYEPLPPPILVDEPPY